MRRFIVILLSIVLLTTVSVCGIREDQDNSTGIGYLVIDPGASFLYIEDIDLCIPGFDNYGCTYFFIPSLMPYFLTINSFEEWSCDFFHCKYFFSPSSKKLFEFQYSIVNE